MKANTTGLPLVFVHGMRVSGTMWQPVIDTLGTRHPTAAPDLPGHGSRRAEPFTLPGAVAAVTDAIDALGGRALVVGLSLGGYVAVATAGSHPDRVLGLVAMGCTATPADCSAPSTGERRAPRPGIRTRPTASARSHSAAPSRDARPAPWCPAA